MFSIYTTFGDVITVSITPGSTLACTALPEYCREVMQVSRLDPWINKAWKV